MKEDPRFYDYWPYENRPKIEWPNGARVAFWVAPNIEFYELDKMTRLIGMGQVFANLYDNFSSIYLQPLRDPESGELLQRHITEGLHIREDLGEAIL